MFGQPASGFGGVGAQQQQAPAFGAAPSPFGTPAAAPAFGAQQAAPNPFGAPAAAPAQTGLFGAQQPATFGSPAFGQSSAAAGFGGFGANTQAKPAFGGFGAAASNPFGASTTTTAFGAPAAGAFGAASTPAFGAQQPAAGFGQPLGSAPSFGAASAPAFGTTTPAFGAAPTGFGAPAAPNPFGAPASSPSPFGGATATGGFGAPTTPAFGAQGFGAAASQPAFGGGTGLFGAASTPAFGAASQPATGFGGFGAAAPAASPFGASPPAATGGVGPGSRVAPFQKTIDKDATSGAAGAAAAASYFVSLSAMPTYINKSHEELRYEDYSAGVKSGSAAAAGAPGAAPAAFGAASAPSPFGAASAPAAGAFGASTPAFGATGAFGAASQPATGFGGFGAPNTGGAFGATSAPSLFGTTSTQAFGGFGASSAAPSPFGTTTGAFGLPQSQAASGGGLFGTSSAPAFGATGAFSTSPSPFGGAASSGGAFGFSSSPSLFGTNTGGAFGAPISTPASSPFGTTSTFGAVSSPFGTTTSAPQASAPFGTGAFGNAFGQAKPAGTPGFGTTTTTPSLFGQASTPSLFGQASAPAASTGFGGFGGFGTTTPAGGGLFGNTAAGGLGTATPGFGMFGNTAAGTPGLFGNTGGGLFGQQQQAAQAQPAAPPSVSQPAYGTLPPLPTVPEPKVGISSRPVRAGTVTGLSAAAGKSSPLLSLRGPAPPRFGANLNRAGSLGLAGGSGGAGGGFLGAAAATASLAPGGGSGVGSSELGGAGGSAKGSGIVVVAGSAVGGGAGGIPLRANAHKLFIREPPPSTEAASSGTFLSPARGGGGASGIAAGYTTARRTPTPEPGEDGSGNEDGAMGSAGGGAMGNAYNGTPAARGASGSPHATDAAGAAADGYANGINGTINGRGSGVHVDPSPASEPHLPRLGRLVSEGYGFSPSVDELRQMYGQDPASLRSVQGFVVSRPGVGEIRWLRSVDVWGAQLEKIVTINQGEVFCYAEGPKPPLGEGLNVPASITLYGIYKRDKATGAPVRDPAKAAAFEKALRTMCARMDARFVAYKPDGGVWKFEVDHFSRYGLLDLDDDEDIAAPNDSNAITGAAAPPPSQPQTRAGTAPLPLPLCGPAAGQKRVAFGVMITEIEEDTVVSAEEDGMVPEVVVVETSVFQAGAGRAQRALGFQLQQQAEEAAVAVAEEDGMQQDDAAGTAVAAGDGDAGMALVAANDGAVGGLGGGARVGGIRGLVAGAQRGAAGLLGITTRGSAAGGAGAGPSSSFGGAAPPLQHALPAMLSLDPNRTAALGSAFFSAAPGGVSAGAPCGDMFSPPAGLGGTAAAAAAAAAARGRVAPAAAATVAGSLQQQQQQREGGAQAGVSAARPPVTCWARPAAVLTANASGALATSRVGGLAQGIASPGAAAATADVLAPLPPPLAPLLPYGAPSSPPLALMLSVGSPAGPGTARGGSGVASCLPLHDASTAGQLVDAGLSMGRSFRVGWGPGGILVIPSVPVEAGSSSFGSGEIAVMRVRAEGSSSAYDTGDDQYGLGASAGLGSGAAARTSDSLLLASAADSADAAAVSVSNAAGGGSGALGALRCRLKAALQVHFKSSAPVTLVRRHLQRSAGGNAGTDETQQQQQQQDSEEDRAGSLVPAWQLVCDAKQLPSLVAQYVQVCERAAKAGANAASSSDDDGSAESLRLYHEAETWRLVDCLWGHIQGETQLPAASSPQDPAHNGADGDDDDDDDMGVGSPDSTNANEMHQTPKRPASLASGAAGTAGGGGDGAAGRSVLAAMQRHARVSRWLLRSAKARVEEALATASSPPEVVLQLMCGYQLAAAAGAAVAAGDVRLATLIAQAGTHACASARAEMALQLRVWQQYGLSAGMNPDRLAVYQLLAGQVLDVQRRVGLDWRRYLGLQLWFATSSTASVAVALQQYREDMAQEPASVPQPVPLHAEGLQPSATGTATAALQAAATAATDLHWELLQLWTTSPAAVAAGYAADGSLVATQEQVAAAAGEKLKEWLASGGLSRLLRVVGYSANPLDHSLAWHLLTVLQALGVLPGGSGSAAAGISGATSASSAVSHLAHVQLDAQGWSDVLSCHLGMISQLQLAGALPEWAVYVACHLPDLPEDLGGAAVRQRLVRELLAQTCPLWDNNRLHQQQHQQQTGAAVSGNADASDPAAAAALACERGGLAFLESGLRLPPALLAEARAVWAQYRGAAAARVAALMQAGDHAGAHALLAGTVGPLLFLAGRWRELYDIVLSLEPHHAAIDQLAIGGSATGSRGHHADDAAASGGGEGTHADTNMDDAAASGTAAVGTDVAGISGPAWAYGGGLYLSFLTLFGSFHDDDDDAGVGSSAGRGGDARALAAAACDPVAAAMAAAAAAAVVKRPGGGAGGASCCEDLLIVASQVQQAQQALAEGKLVMDPLQPHNGTTDADSDVHTGTLRQRLVLSHMAARVHAALVLAPSYSAAAAGAARGGSPEAAAGRGVDEWSPVSGLLTPSALRPGGAGRTTAPASSGVSAAAALAAALEARRGLLQSGLALGSGCLAPEHVAAGVAVAVTDASVAAASAAVC